MRVNFAALLLLPLPSLLRAVTNNRMVQLSVVIFVVVVYLVLIAVNVGS